MTYQPESPNVFMIAGPNGAGKTTAVMTLLPEYLHINHFINADEIAKGLSPFKPEESAIDAGRLMLWQLDKVIEKKKSFAFETTGSGRVHLRTLEKCKKAGYFIHIIYLYLSSAEMAVERVANRVLQGGHFVPENDIKRRYLKGLTLILKDYSCLADEIQIIDNSHGLMNLVASKNLGSDWKILNTSVWNTIKKQVGYEH